MPSNAFSQHLEAVLADAQELVDAHSKLKTGLRGRQWRLGALNRAVIVMCVSAWEAYIEELVREGVNALRPPAVGATPLGVYATHWPALAALAHSSLARFNTPNSENVRKLIERIFGLPDITAAWSWQNSTVANTASLLDSVLTIRHETAHGVHPRPMVNNKTATSAIDFFRRLAARSDNQLLTHLTTTLGLATAPWTPVTLN